MKLSAILFVSVPVVALCPGAALAANEATGDTASFLQASLATINKKDCKQAQAHKISHAASPASIGAGTIRLRPFVPNRYLPSERDLQRALVAEKAQYDSSADQPAEPAAGGPAGDRSLSGSVSGYWSQQPASPYDQYLQKLPAQAARKIKSAARAVASRSPRVMPGQAPVLPETFGDVSSTIPFIPEPPASQAASPIMPDFTLPAQPARTNGQFPGARVQSRSANNCIVQAPVLSPQESAMLDRQVDLNRPGYGTQSFNGDMSGSVMDNPSNGAGPPPFPLNLLPMNAMQNLQASRGHHRAPTQQARFGSWHNGSSLPEAGFQSYLPRRPVASFNYVRVAAPTSVVYRKPAAKKKTNRPASLPAIARTAPKKAPMTVATYPPYVSGEARPYMF